MSRCGKSEGLKRTHKLKFKLKNENHLGSVLPLTNVRSPSLSLG